MATASLDVLSEVLQGAQLQSWIIGEAAFTAPWGVKAEKGSSHFYCILQGGCQLEIDNSGVIAQLEAGDLLVITHDLPHFLRDSSDSPSISLKQVFEQSKIRGENQTVFGGGGSMTKMICGSFSFDRQDVSSLFALLPPFIVLKGENREPAPWLSVILRLMLAESDLTQPGRKAVVDRLAQILIIQSLRSGLNALPDGGGNWFSALMDPDIGPVLRLMHTKMEHPWTVASLAKQVGMSRSMFAERFKVSLSTPPLQYLFECRMRKACLLLTENNHKIKEISSRVGYATEAAFSKAFKRWNGKSPDTFRRSALADPIPIAEIQNTIDCRTKHCDISYVSKD